MAAYGILKDLSKGRPYYEDGIKPVLTKGGQKWFHDTANFLKHADRDPDAVLHPNNLPDNESRIAAGSGDLLQRDYYPLTGASADIHAANKAAGLVITRDNAIKYMRFFLTFLQMEDGEPFVIVESLNGYRLVNNDRPDQRKPDDMRFVCVGETAEGDAFAFRGYMAYRGELFGVSMHVYKNGAVEMLDDDPMGFIVRLH